jgi:hypothetical protein
MTNDVQSNRPQGTGPGEETVFQISYDPRVSQEFGKDVRKQIYLVSNDPLVPVVEFHITASVEAKDE